MIYIGRILALLVAIPAHEFAHGYVSYKLGDPTAKYDGRLSLNPKHHLDPFGVLLIFLTGIGWAKPVMVNSLYYKDRDKGIALTALAGPAANVIVALIFLMLYKLVSIFYAANFLFSYSSYIFVSQILNIIVITNINLAVFNMIPFPPLDGFKVFSFLFPSEIKYKLLQFEQYSFIILVVAIYSGILSRPLFIINNFIYSILNVITSFLVVQ